MCESDFAQLVVSGLPTAEQILEAWQSIFFEYCELVELAEDDFVAVLEMKLEARKRHLEIARNWIKILKYYKSEKVAAAVTYLYGVQFDFENDALYNNAIAEVEAELRMLSFDIKVKDAELKSLQESQSTKKDTIDRKYFATVFFRLNNYAKREAVNELTTVENYCAALRDYMAFLANAKIAN